MIKLESINYNEAIRYLGDSRVQMNSQMESLITQCEDLIIKAATPRYIYKEIPLENSPLLVGNDIKNHLKDCTSSIIIAATLGADIDKIIRTYQVSDMAKAVVLDSMASVAIEQVCTEIDEILAKEFSPYNLTWRFSPGYGDYPIELQKEYINLLDAPRKIGLCLSESLMLTPTKSVTAILGLSNEPIEKKRKSCAICNLNKTCKFRKAGTRCDL